MLTPRGGTNKTEKDHIVLEEVTNNNARTILLKALKDATGSVFVTAASYGDKTFEVQTNGEVLNPPGDFAWK